MRSAVRLILAVALFAVTGGLIWRYWQKPPVVVQAKVEVGKYGTLAGLKDPQGNNIVSPDKLFDGYTVVYQVKDAQGNWQKKFFSAAADQASEQITSMVKSPVKQSGSTTIVVDTADLRIVNSFYYDLTQSALYTSRLLRRKPDNHNPVRLVAVTTYSLAEARLPYMSRMSSGRIPDVEDDTCFPCLPLPICPERVSGLPGQERIACLVCPVESLRSLLILPGLTAPEADEKYASLNGRGLCPQAANLRYGEEGFIWDADRGDPARSQERHLLACANCKPITTPTDRRARVFELHENREAWPIVEFINDLISNHQCTYPITQHLWDFGDDSAPRFELAGGVQAMVTVDYNVRH
ncbi:MAG: hypothetical protein HYR56_02565 [Acidobacteria bacterium]|nr:hypothetical protein [Acidobacteriota bacterium]MBI3426453.1 hypothetical protein [Acidobacteriota bacterium]